MQPWAGIKIITKKKNCSQKCIQMADEGKQKTQTRFVVYELIFRSWDVWQSKEEDALMLTLLC